MSSVGNISTHAYNVALGPNNTYIRNDQNSILLQRIADGKLVYLPEQQVVDVFGPDSTYTNGNGDIDNHDTEENSEDIEEPGNSTSQFEEAHDTSRGEPFGDKSRKRMWTYQQTLALIASVEVYKDHLHHAIKRKHVWQNISNDLLSQGIVFSADTCKKKWTNLLKTYKNCKDLKGKTGRGPTRFMFSERMDEILGTEPHISSPHSIDVSAIEARREVSTPPSLPSAEITAASDEQTHRPEHGVDENEPPRDVTPEPTPPKKKKTVVMKLREEIREMKTKSEARKAIDERKLQLLEKKIKLDERKVIALEKLVGIAGTHHP